jgi:hypothetical protein
MNLSDPRLKQLTEEIEKVRRRKVINYDSKDFIQYLDPFDNLGKIKIPNNHLILGRRGSGKTTLLLSTIKDVSNSFILPLDCQIFREWTTDKTILFILKKILEKLKIHIADSTEYQKLKDHKPSIGFFIRIKNLLVKNNIITRFDEYLCLIATIKKVEYLIGIIENLPLEPIKISVKSSSKNTETRKIVSEAEVKALLKMSVSGNVPVHIVKLDANIETALSASKTISSQKDATKEVNENYEYTKTIHKQEKIAELILVFAEIFSEFSRITDEKTVIYLDDFYLVSWESQPDVIQYFHDIYKNSKNDSFCYKICSIPNRTRLNKDGKVDFSIKDDFSPIRLDKELYDFNNLIEFLLRITANLNPNINLTSNDIRSLFSNEEVLQYTVVATGGVPRDFLVILSEIIKIAIAENAVSIKKENLYSAISDMKQDKEQNIEIECDMSVEKIRKALEMIQKEVIDELKTNVILYPLNLSKEHEQLLKNLVNLRYLHVINENTSSEKVKKESFVSYLIDMTFYATGKRLKQGFDFRHFWAQDAGHRHTYLRNAPIWNFSDEFIKN